VGAARLGQTIGPLLAGVSMGLVGTGPTFVIGSSIAGLILMMGLFGPFPSVSRRKAPVGCPPSV
jgi:hypothetical protein